MNSLAVRTLLRLSSAWLRNPWLRFGKTALWNKVCVPHLSWRNEEIVCRTVQGHRFRVRPTDFVENRICFFGTWEPAITEVFDSTVQKGDVVVDVGANIGYYTVLASNLVGKGGQVFALEPSESIRRRLRQNLDLNQIQNVEVLPYAAWHESGTATLQLMDGNRGGSTLGTTDRSSTSEAVEMARLDDLIPRNVWTRIRLLKIDVEGAEWSALRGAEGILSNAPEVTVICEVSPERLDSLSAKADDLLSFMTELGFSAACVENDYSHGAYIDRLPSRLTELTESPTASCDVVFTRTHRKDRVAQSEPARLALADRYSTHEAKGR